MGKADDNNVATNTEALVEGVIRAEGVAPSEKKVEWVRLSTAEALRAHIFNTPDIQEEIVDVPEWKVQIKVKGMNGTERSRVMKSALNPDNTPNLEKLYPGMVIATCHHPETDEKIFGEADRDILNTKAGGILERLALVASRLSGIGEAQNTDILKN